MSPESHLQALQELRQEFDELKRFMNRNFYRIKRNSKILEVIILVVALGLFAVWLAGLSGCSNEKMAGEDCDNKGETTCGTACEDIGSSDTCGVEDAVLYCDGYEWVVSQKCTGDCSCVEKNGGANCECPNYY